MGKDKTPSWSDPVAQKIAQPFRELLPGDARPNREGKALIYVLIELNLRAGTTLNQLLQAIQFYWEQAEHADPSRKEGGG